MSFPQADHRILIVDGTQKNLERLGTLLREEGYQLNVVMP